MKSISIKELLYRILGIILGVILIDYLYDGNLNITYHLLQVSHNYLFRLKLENVLYYFHMHKQLLFTLDAIVCKIGLTNIALIVLAQSLAVIRCPLVVAKFNISNQRSNFSQQYKNSSILHTDISQANIALP